MMNDPPNYRPSVTPSENEPQMKELVDLMRHCWAEGPNERPPFVEIAKILRQINRGKSVRFTSLC